MAIYDLIGADLLWSRLHGIIRMHTYVTESEVTDCYAAYRSCDGFCKPSVARSHSVAADFLLDGPHGIIHPSEDVTEHLVPAFHSTTFGCIFFCFAVFGGQIRFDCEHLFIDLLAYKLCKHITMSYK